MTQLCLCWPLLCLVLMVRGLFSKLVFPYAQFSCCKLSGELLVDPVWEAVSRLERQGFRVMSLTCDGATTNRKLWKLHSGDGDEVTYKVKNIYAPEAERSLYFISDPPHLLKTVRNCWWNKKRKMQVYTDTCNSVFLLTCRHMPIIASVPSVCIYSAIENTYHGPTWRTYT